MKKGGLPPCGGRFCAPVVSPWAPVVSPWAPVLSRGLPWAPRWPPVILRIAGVAGDGDNNGDGRGHGEEDPGGLGDGDLPLIRVIMIIRL